MKYLDFQLEIGQGSGREYPVTLIVSPAGEAREIMPFPYDEVNLQNRLFSLELALLYSSSVSRSEEQIIQDFGNDLFKALVSGEVRNRFDVSLDIARKQGKGLRFKLRVQAPELAALPWEYLYDERRGEYLCLSQKTPIVRYLELFTPIPALTVTPPLRILGMIASPEGLPPLDVVREKQRIETALQDLQKRGIVELTWLPGQTWRDIMTAMRRGPWHIFHFIGHGGFDRGAAEGLIALADEQGRQQFLAASDLARLLADHYPLRLVFLNSSEGARGGNRDIYSSTAAMLVRRGIPAVLAMQYNITDRAAIKFARTFFEALASGLPIDASVTEARIAVNIAVQNTLEWGTPVLYTRSPDCVLFDFVEVSAPPTDHPTSVGAGGTAASPPPETPPPKVEPGHLWVETKPREATVAFLNIQAEFTQGLELEPGRFEVEVSADAHETKREWVELAAGEERHVKITLAGLKARLWVETLPPGAKVSFLNLDTEFTQGLELAPGRYEVEVSADGFKSKGKWIELGLGEWTHVGVDLYPEATLAGWDRIEIRMGNLLTQQVDAIVCSTSPDLGFRGSIGKQLRQRLGEEFLSKVRSQGRPPLGGVLVTEAGSLPARYIILTPIGESDRPATLETVAQGAAAAMAATATLKEVQTLAFATMGVSDGLDQHQVARLLLTTAISYLEQQVRLVRVLFVLSDQESYDTYQAAYHELAAKVHPPLPGFERLSKSSQAAWRWAEAFRQRVDAREVHTEYLLAGLYQGPTGPTRQLLTLFEDKATVQAELETLVNEMTGTGLHFPDIGPQTPDLPQNLSANLQAALLRAAEAADAQGSKSISPRHLLAGILAMPEGRAARWIVDRLQVDRETLFRLIAHGADVQLPLEEIRQASTRKPGAAQFSAGNAYALVVGIGNYLEETPIPTAAKNAKSVYAVLTDPLYCGYPPQNVRLLLDREATRSNLGQALQNIIKRSNQDSTIFFYFSGHTSEKSLSETAWSGINMLPKHILAGNVVLVIDYCGPKTRFSMDPIEYLKKKKMALKDPDILNWLLIFSSLADEKAYKMPGSENSILTHYLIEALRGNVVSQDGLIRAEDLYTYIQERVRAETEYSRRPGPVLQDIQSGNFPFALWKGGIIETPAPSYRLFLATDRAQYTVGERIRVQIELQAATVGSPEAFELPAGTGELHCFAASSPGLQVIEPGAASIFLTPGADQPLSATIELQATLPGSRSCSFNLFADDRRLDVEGSSIAVEVSPPRPGEERPAILPTLDVRVAARPEFVLQVELDQPQGDVVPQHLTYRLTSRMHDLQVENEVVGKVVLQPADLKRIQALVYRTVQSAAGLQPEDVRERMISLGRYLYDHLFPAREAGTWRSYLWQAEAVWQERRRAGKLPPTWLIIEDEGVWLPWELVVPYRAAEAAPGFLAEHYLLSRWIEGLGRPLYGEVPMREVALTHYKALEPGAGEQDEELKAWRALLKAAGAEGILNVVKPDTPVYGLHILRHVDQLTSQLDIRPRDGALRARTPEEEMLRAQLDLRAKRPVVTLSIIDKPDQSPSVTTGGWILPDRVMPFLRAGASAVSGPWWPTCEAADQAFWTTFYDLLEGGMGLGEAVWRARLAVQRELPDRPDWLAYTLFGDPRAATYVPEASAGYATLECLNPDEPLRPGKPYRFRATLGSRPPQWYRDRLVRAEASPDHLRALFLAPTLQTAMPEPVTMHPVSRMLHQATVELTPTASGQHPLLAQILQGDEHLKTLQLSLIVGEETRGGQANG